MVVLSSQQKITNYQDTESAPHNEELPTNPLDGQKFYQYDEDDNIVAIFDCVDGQWIARKYDYKVLSVETLSALTAFLGDVYGGSYTQDVVATDPLTGTQGVSSIILRSGVITNSFTSSELEYSRKSTVSSGVIGLFINDERIGYLTAGVDDETGNKILQLRSTDKLDIRANNDSNIYLPSLKVGTSKGNSIEIKGNKIAANSISALDSEQYTGFNRDRSDMMNFYAGKTSDGAKRLGSDDLYETSGSGKALHVTSGNSIVAYSSASKYKEGIEKYEGEELAEKLLDVALYRWYDNHQLTSWAHEIENGPGEYDRSPVKKIYGLMAEDVASAGLKEFVEYGESGEIESIHYETLWTLLIPLVKNLTKKVQELEIKIEQMESVK